MAERIHVVIAVIVRNGRVLLTQRGPTQSYPWRWESPGGKVERGESESVALGRELLEEIGVSSWTGQYLTTLDLDPGGPIAVNRALRVSLFDVHIGDHVPRALASIGLGWFSAPDLVQLDMLPANDAYRGELAARLVRESAP